MSRPRRLGLLLASSLLMGALGLVVGCHAARVLAPPPAFRAASANDFAVDVEFAEPLDRASAQSVAHYSVYPFGHPEAPIGIFSATLIDTATGRVVQLLLSGGPLADSSLYSVGATGVRSIAGASTGTRTTSFTAGLGYGRDIAPLMATHCNSCHGALRADGQYRTDSYAGLFGPGSDGARANIIAGDPSSLCIKRSKPFNSMYTLGAMSYLDFEILYNWIVSYGARR